MFGCKLVVCLARAVPKGGDLILANTIGAHVRPMSLIGYQKHEAYIHTCLDPINHHIYQPYLEDENHLIVSISPGPDTELSERSM